jgi:hypothetical protein
MNITGKDGVMYSARTPCSAFFFFTLHKLVLLGWVSPFQK